MNENPQLLPGDYAVMVGYLLTVVLIGYFCSRQKEKTTEQYLLGGRKMPWFIVGVSLYISLLSTLSLVAVPGEAFSHGISFLAMDLFNITFGICAFFIFVRFYFRVKTFTPYSYLERRFDVRIRTFASAIFFCMRLTYLAIIMYACAKVFEGAANWPAWFSIVLVGTIGIAYTVMGGIRAVMWTDFIQFIILAGGLGCTLYFCFREIPEGAVGIVKFAFENERGFEYWKDPRFYTLDPFVRLNLWVLLFGAVGNAIFTYGADQLTIQRMLTTSSFNQAKRSMFTAILVGLPASYVLYFLGLAMFAYYSHNPLSEGQIAGDTALFHFISTRLPSPIPGLIISAMLAAVMSTLDSGINSLATVLTKDIYLRLVKPKASEIQQLLFSKISTLLIGLLAIGASLTIAFANESIGQSMMEVFSLWGAFFNVLWPMFLLGVTTKRLRGTHILISAAVAWVATAILMAFYLKNKGTDREISFMLLSLPGSIVMVLVGYLINMMAKPLPDNKTTGLTLWSSKEAPELVKETSKP